MSGVPSTSTDRSVSDIAFFAPRSLQEALELRARERLRAVPLAGGTDLMVVQNAGARPEGYLSLGQVPELKGIRRGESRLELGAGCTFTELIRDPLVVEHLPELSEASRQIGAVQIQNRGTLGGNLVNASPAGDSLPVLCVLDAVLVLVSLGRGLRKVSIHDFYTGYRQTLLADDELLLRVEVPLPHPESRGSFGKVGSRQAQTISKVMAAMRSRLDAQGCFQEVALSFGSVGPVVKRARKVEAALIGHPPSLSLVDRVEPLLQDEISPIDDLRSSAQYRRFLATGLLRRFMRAWIPPGAEVIELNR